MPDMLVKLYELAPLDPYLQEQSDRDIIIRRGIIPEKHFVLQWVKQHFSDFWVSECDVAFSRLPVSCFLAVQQGTLIGFACYDTTRLGFFGPTGVGEAARGKGTGTALLMACLHDMWGKGYGYAIIGHTGPTAYYARVCNAVEIPDSTPGVYAGMLRKSD